MQRIRIASTILSTSALFFAAALSFAQSAPVATPPPKSASESKLDLGRAKPVAAELATNREEAKVRFARAVQFYNEGDFKLALIEFQRVYDLINDYRYLYNIAQVNLQLNNYTRALEALERYLKEGEESIPDDRRAEVRRDLASLEERTARVSIKTNLSGVEVTIDDLVVGLSPFAQPILIDAGEHRIVAQKSGYQKTTKAITLAGRDDISVEMDILRDPPRTGPDGTEMPDRDPQRRLPWLAAGWLCTSALAVGAGVTGALAISNASSLRDLRDNPPSSAADRQSAADAARSFGIAADMLTGAAIAAAGTMMFFTLRKPGARDTPPAVGLFILPKRIGLSGQF